MAAGFAGAQAEPAILLFEDGAWSAAEVPGTRGQVMGLAQLGGQLIAVGNELPDARTGFIWTSADGRTWTEAASITDAALYDVVATHDIAVAVGAHLDEEMASTAAAWTSSDAEDLDGRCRRRRRGVVDAQRDGLVGRVRGVRRRPERTDAAGLDRRRPCRLGVADDRPRATSHRVDIVDWDGGLAVAGASDKSGNQHPYVALSGDGRAWTQTMLSAEERATPPRSRSPARRSSRRASTPID